MRKQMIFCTLFDSNYLDKGIALYNSINKVSKNFRIYILAMDTVCFSILTRLELSYAVIINLEEFIEKENLLNEFHNRSNVEFCWTCTSHLIDFVINVMGEDICTYVDADVFFYSDPSILIDEMGNKTVQIVEHRFTRSFSDLISMRESGRFCVQFNTFKKEVQAMKLLEWWKSCCRDSCSNTSTNEKVFGDQKYLEGWEEYPFVSILNNLGGGVAPWNVPQYALLNQKGYRMIDKKSKIVFDLVFYHFHNISYIDNNTVDISVYQRAWGIDDELIKAIYIPYLRELRDIKEMLKREFGVNLFLKIHPALMLKNNFPKPKKKRSISSKLSLKKMWFYIDSLIRNKIALRKNIIHF